MKPKTDEEIMLETYLFDEPRYNTRLAIAFARESERQKILEIIDKSQEKHIHPNHQKLDYYDKWESSGCQFCYINRKLNELKKKLEDLK